MSNTKRQIRVALGLTPEQQSDIINLEKMRSASAVGFGFACYTLTRDGNTLHGKNVGLTGEEEDARKWVDGDDTIKLLRIER